MTRPFSLHHLSLLDADPFELVDAAVAGGFDHVGVRIVSPDPGVAVFDLIEDRAERQRFARHLDDSGIRMLDVEAVWLREQTVVSELEAALAAAQELGASYLLTVGYDFEPARLLENVGELTVLAARYGIVVAVEAITYSAITGVDDALRIVDAVGAPNTAILVDSLQFFRSGTPLERLASIPADRLPYLQLSDAPRVAPATTDLLRQEARTDRLIPGTGELDLIDLLRTLPAGIPIAVEVPSRQLAGLPRDEAARILHRAARSLADEADGRTREADPAR